MLAAPPPLTVITDSELFCLALLAASRQSRLKVNISTLVEAEFPFPKGAKVNSTWLVLIFWLIIVHCAGKRPRCLCQMNKQVDKR